LHLGEKTNLLLGEGVFISINYKCYDNEMRNRNLLAVDVAGYLSDASYLGEKTNLSL
jgi:hypothetical protein